MHTFTHIDIYTLSTVYAHTDKYRHMSHTHTHTHTHTHRNPYTHAQLHMDTCSMPTHTQAHADTHTQCHIHSHTHTHTHTHTLTGCVSGVALCTAGLLDAGQHRAAPDAGCGGPRSRLSRPARLRSRQPGRHGQPPPHLPGTAPVCQIDFVLIQPPFFLIMKKKKEA